ncbi:Ovarian abundant message protein [Holothuria leucospilota]|uniref:Ovarian abundant message protein n=1 Tax=Holothuria leucospilota TaxID=206669 RepID=A0A9Q1BI67_HOLLE|nr:Ovarian abundant message protein [Holothuria leucospilota]
MEKQRISQEHCAVGKLEHSKDAQRTRSCVPEQFGKKNIYEASSNVSWKNIVKKVRRPNQYVTQKETLGEPAPFFGIRATVSPFGFLSKEKLVAPEILSKPEADNQKKIERDGVGSERTERIGSFGTNTFSEKFGVGVYTILEKNNNGRLEKISSAGQISNKKIQEDGSRSERINEKDENSNSSLRSVEGEGETCLGGEAPKEEETLLEEEVPLKATPDHVEEAFSDEKSAVEGETCLDGEVPKEEETPLEEELLLKATPYHVEEAFSDEKSAVETHFEEKPDFEGKASSLEGHPALWEKMLVEGDVDKDCNLKEETSFEVENPIETTHLEAETPLEAKTDVESEAFLERHTPHGREELVERGTPSGTESKCERETSGEGEALVVEELPVMKERPLKGNTSHEEKPSFQRQNQFGTENTAERVVLTEEEETSPIGRSDPAGKPSHEENATGEGESVLEESRHLHGKADHEGKTSLEGHTPHESENFVGGVTPVAKECRLGGKTAFEGEAQTEETPLVEEGPMKAKSDPRGEMALQGCTKLVPEITVEGETLIEKIHPGDKEPHPEGKTSFVAETPLEGEGHCEGESYLQRGTPVEEEMHFNEGEQVEGQTSLDRETEQGVKVTQDLAPHLTPEVCELSENTGQQEGSHVEEVSGPVGQISGDGNDQIEPSCTTGNLAITEQPNKQVTSQIVTVIVEDRITELPNARQNDLCRDSLKSEDTCQKSEEKIEETFCGEGSKNTAMNMNESSGGTTDKVLEEALMNVQGMITFTTGEELTNKVASLTTEENVHQVETGECIEDTQQSTERRDSHPHADGDMGMQSSGIREDVMVTQGQCPSPNTTFTDLTRLSPIRTIPAVANTNSTHTLTSSSCDNSINTSESGNVSQNIASSPEKQLSELMRVVDELFAIHQDGVAVESADVTTLLDSGDGTNDSKNLPLLFKTPPRRPDLSGKLGEDTTYGESMHLVEESCRYPRNSPSKNTSQLDTVPSVSHSYQTVSLPAESSFGDSDCNFQVNLSSNKDSPGPSNLLENSVSHEAANQIHENDSSKIQDSPSTFHVPEVQLKEKEETLTKRLADIVESSKSRTKVKHKLQEKRETTSDEKVGIILKSSDSIQEERQDKINLKEDFVTSRQGSLGSSSPIETAALPEIPVHSAYGSKPTSSTDIPVPGFRIVPQYDIPEPVNESFPTSDEVVPAIAMEVEILNGRQEEEEGGVFVPPGSIEDLSGDETPKKSRYVRKSKKAPAKKCSNKGKSPVEEPPKRKRGRPRKEVKENLEKVETGSTRKVAKKLPKRRKFESEEEEIKNAAEVLTSLFSSDDSDWSWRPSRPGISERRIDNAHEKIKSVGVLDGNKQQKVISDSTLAETLGNKSNAKLKQGKNGEQGTAVVDKNSITPDMAALLSKFESQRSADQSCKEKVISKIGCHVCKGDSRSCARKKRTQVQRKKLQVPRITTSYGVKSNYGPQSGHSCSYQLTFDDDDDVEENSAVGDNLPVRNKEKCFKNGNDKEMHLSESSIQKTLYWVGEKTAEIRDSQSLQLSVKENIQVKSPGTAQLGYKKDFESQCNILQQPSDSNMLKKNADSVQLGDNRSSQHLGVEIVQELSEAKSDLEENKNAEAKQLPTVKVSENITQKDKTSTEDSDCVSQQPVTEKFIEKSCQEEDLKQKQLCVEIAQELSEAKSDLEENKNVETKELPIVTVSENTTQKDKTSTEDSDCVSQQSVTEKCMEKSCEEEDLKQKQLCVEIAQELSEAKSDMEENKNVETKQLHIVMVSENITQKDKSSTEGSDCVSQQPVTEKCIEKSSQEEDLKQKSELEGANSKSIEKKDPLPSAIVFEVIKDSTQSDYEAEDLPITFLQATSDGASELDPLEQLNCKCSVVSEPLRISMNNELVDEKVAIIVDNISRCSEDNGDQHQPGGKTQLEECKDSEVEDQNEEEISMSLPTGKEMSASQKGKRIKNLKTGFSPSLMKKYEQIRQISEKSRARRMKKYQQRQKSYRGVSVRKQWEVEIVDEALEMVSSVVNDDSVDLQRTVKDMKTNDKTEPSVEEILSPSTLSKYSELIKNRMSPKVVLTDYRRLSGKSSPESSPSLQKSSITMKNETSKGSDKRTQFKEKYKNILSSTRSPSKKQERNTPSQMSYYSFGKDSNDSKIHHQKENKTQSFSLMQKMDFPKVESSDDVCIVSGDEMVMSDEDSYKLATLDAGKETGLSVKQSGKEKDFRRKQDIDRHGNQNDQRKKKVMDTSSVVNDVSTEEEGSNYKENNNTEIAKVEERRPENLHLLKGDGSVLSISSNEAKSTSLVEGNLKDKATANSDKEVVETAKGKPKNMERGDNSLSSVPVNLPDCVPGKAKISKLVLKDILPRQRGRQRRGSRKTKTAKEMFVSKDVLENSSSVNEVKSSVHERKGQDEVCSDNGRKGLENEAENLGQNVENNVLLVDLQEAELVSLENVGSTNKTSPHNGHVTDISVVEETRLLLDEESLENKVLEEQKVLNDEGSSVISKDEKGDSVASCISLSKESPLQDELSFQTELAFDGESSQTEVAFDEESSQTELVFDEGETDSAENVLPVEKVCVSKEKQRSPEKDICSRTKATVAGKQTNKDFNLMSMENGTLLHSRESRGGDGTPDRENTSESGLEKQGNHSPDKNNLNAETTSVGLSKEISTDLEKVNDDVLGDGVEMEKESGVKKLERADDDATPESGDDLHLKVDCGQNSIYTSSEDDMDFVGNLPLSVKLRRCFVVLKPLGLEEFEKGGSYRSELRKNRKRKMRGGLKNEGRKRRKLNAGVDGSPIDSLLTEVQQVSEIHFDSASSDVCDLKHRKEAERKRKEKKGKKRKKQRRGEEEEEKLKKTDIGLRKEVFDRDDGVTGDSFSSAIEDDLSSCDSKGFEITPTAEKEEVEGILEQDASDKEDGNNANDIEEWMDAASGNSEAENSHKDRETHYPDGSDAKNGEGKAADEKTKEDIGESEKHGEGDAFCDDDCLSITAECTDLLSEFEDEEMEAETEPTEECEPAIPTAEQTDAKLEYENVSSDDNFGLTPDGSRVQKQGPSSVKGTKDGTSGNVPPQDLLPVKLMPRIPKKSTAIIAAVTSRNASQSNRIPSDGVVAGDDVGGPHPPSITRKLHPDIPTVSFAGENHPGLPVPSSNGESPKEHGKLSSTSGPNAATSKQAANAGWQLTDKTRQKCPPGYCFKFAEFGKCHYGATCRFKHVLLQDIPRPEVTHGNTSQPSQLPLPPPPMQGVQQSQPLMPHVISKPVAVTESSKSRILNSSPFPEEGPLLPDPPTLGDRSEIAITSSDNLLESANNLSSLPPLFPHEMEEFLTYIETCSKDGELLQNKTSDAPEVEEKRDNVSSRRDDLTSQGNDLTSRRDLAGGTAARSSDSSNPAAGRSNSLSVVHNLLRKKRVSDAWNVYRLKTQQEGFAPDRQLLTQIIKAFPSARFSKLKWKDCREALKEFGRTFAEDITLYCLEIIQHLCDSQENDPEDDEDYEDPLPIAVSVFKDCVPCQSRIGAEFMTLNILAEKLIQESHWSLLGTFVSLQLNKGFRPSLRSLSDVISKYHVLNNHYDDLVNLMKKIDESNLKLPSSLYDGVKNCLAASSQYTDEGLAVLKMKGKFYPLDSIEKSLVEMCSVDQHEIELTEAPAPESDRTSQIPENVSSDEKFVDGETREIATIIQKARDVDTLVQLFLTIVGSGEAHLLDARVQDCFAFTISKMAPTNHCHLFRKFVQSVVNDPRTGDAERRFVVGIGKILFRTSWKNKHAANAYQLLEIMSEYDEKSIERLFVAKEKPKHWGVIYSELHSVVSCYINACNILQACRVLNSLACEEWGVNFWKKTSNSVKWRNTIIDLGKRLTSAGYLTECLRLLRNFSQGMPAPSRSMRTRQVTKEVFNLLLSNSFERGENVFALEQVFPAIQELSVLDKNNTILMVRVFASQETPETTRMAKELYQKGMKEGIYFYPVINESMHEGKVQVCNDPHEISIIVQEFFRQSDKFLTGVFTTFKCDEDRMGMFVNRMKFRFLVTVAGSPAESNTSSADAIVDETLMKIIQELAKVISQFNCQIETLNEKEKAVNLPPDAIKERFLSNVQRQMFR